MSLQILAYDVQFARSAEELHRLTSEKTAEGWMSEGAPRDRIRKDALTGESRFSLPRLNGRGPQAKANRLLAV